MTNREEVAEKLREAAEDIEEVSPYPAVALNKTTNIIAINEITSYQDFFNRLADLIDPTCKIENAGEVPLTKELLTTWFCSECGSPIYNDMQPSYCIYCGARVVRDES